MNVDPFGLTGRANGQIRDPVVIEVSGSERHSEVVVVLGTARYAAATLPPSLRPRRRSRTRRRQQPARRAIDHVNGARVFGIANILVRRADGQVAISVMVKIGSHHSGAAPGSAAFFESQRFAGPIAKVFARIVGFSAGFRQNLRTRHSQLHGNHSCCEQPPFRNHVVLTVHIEYPPGNQFELM